MELRLSSVRVLELEPLERQTSILEDLPFRIRRLAKRIETGDLCFNEREVRFLAEFYKRIVEGRPRSFSGKIKSFFLLLYLWFRYGFDYILDLTEAVNTLAGALTDLVERNDPSYPALIQKVFASAQETGKELTLQKIDAFFEKVENSLH